MIGGFITVKEAAEKWNLNERTVQKMCGDGRIQNAVKFGRSWAIPKDTPRPMDKRITLGKYKDWRKKIKVQLKDKIMS